MLPDSIPAYTLDPTGTNPDNLITNETHVLEQLYVRVIATNKGAYFGNSLVVRNNNTTLVEGTDYVPFYLHDELTYKFGEPIYTLILVLNPFIVGQLSLSYQILGGRFDKPDTTIATNYSTILGRQATNDWISLLSPREDSLDPDVINPHEEYRPFRIGVVLERLEDIRRTLVYGDKDDYRTLLQNVRPNVPFVDCYKDLKVIPNDTPVSYAQFLGNLQDNIVSSVFVLYTDNCSWVRNSTQTFYIDTSYTEEPIPLYWEIYTDDPEVNLVDYLGNNLSGQINTNQDIVSVDFTIPPLTGIHINFSFFIGLKRDPSDDDYIASSMPINLPD